MNTWNDLMKMTFGKIQGQPPRYTADKQGLNNAITELRNFKACNNRLPKSSDKEMSAIKSGISRKRWEKFGVKSWEDLMKKTF